MVARRQRARAVLAARAGACRGLDTRFVDDRRAVWKARRSAGSLGLRDERGTRRMRVNARVAAAIAAAAMMVVPGIARGAELPRGPVTAATVASAQAESTAAQTASTEAARQAAEAGVALDAAKAASTAAAAAAAANPTPANVAAAAAASAAQATAQQAFDAKTAAAATALKAATDAQDNATREAASFAALSGGPTTEGTTEIPETDVQPPTYLHSDNVTLVKHVRGLYSTSTAGKSCPAYNPTKCPGYSSLNFLHYDNLGYDVMVANGTAGLSVWSLKDPANPKWIGQVTVDDLKNGTKTDPTDPTKTVPIIPDNPANWSQFWEGENMTVDSRRKLAFMSRDSGTKGQIIIDLKDP